MSTLSNWNKFCISLALADRQFSVAIRKIVPNASFTTQIDDSIKLENMRYSENGTKISMLKKYYFNQESIDKALAALEKIKKRKKQSSVAFSTIGQEKKFTHHQHCIQSIVVSYYPKDKSIRYTVFYRSCEVIKIFTGDMVFLREVIMPIFGEGPVTFMFSNAAINSMYIPLLFIYKRKTWMEALKVLRESDPSYYKCIYSWCKRYFNEDAINYKSAERVQSFLKEHIDRAGREEILSSFRKSLSL